MTEMRPVQLPVRYVEDARRGGTCMAFDGGNVEEENARDVRRRSRGRLIVELGCKAS